MATDHIRYDVLARDALRGVLRKVLTDAASHGLPGEHHFFITFKTRAAGVSAPPELIEQYPDEMMIVLQHQYWDLAPGETFFSVTLKFGGQPKTLSIPYTAITQFRDPSVPYGLQFIVPEPDEPASPALAPKAEPTEKPPAPAEKPSDGPKIVSLDQFRKK